MQMTSLSRITVAPIAIAFALWTISSPPAIGADPVGKVAKRTQTASSEKKGHPLEPAIELARASLASLADVKDYEATFVKKEMVNGVLYPHHTKIKHRVEPFSVYMLFVKLHQGREVMYVEGLNNGNMVAHETGVAGLIGSISLSPTSAMALAEGTNPITRIGMQKMIEGVIAEYEREMQHDGVEVKYYPNAKLADRECQVIQSTYLNPKLFKYAKTLLYLDKETKYPVRVEHYGHPAAGVDKPPLVGEWTYSDIKVNIGLTDADFDIRNPKYNF